MVALWLADRHPAFDRPGLYRRPPVTLSSTQPTATGWDALLIGTASLVLILVGIGGLIFSLFLVGVIVSTWLG
jgi:hypothetical protein